MNQLNQANSDTGTEIATLRAELKKVPSASRVMADQARLSELQRLVDQRYALLRMTQARRTALIKEKRWVLSEIAGYERGLVLVGGGGRLQQRIDGRVVAAERITEEIGEVDRSIEVIHSEIGARLDEMVGILRRSVADSEEKLRRAAHARSQRQAWQLGDVGRFATWSPVAVEGYRAWNPAADGFYGVRQRWPHPSLAATCDVAGPLPHTDGSCAQVAFGCGIYAAKSVEALMDEARATPGSRIAIGLVGLEGKVVEHERGYRAEIATVLALAIIDGGVVRLVDDRDELIDLFFEPALASQCGSIALPTPTSTTQLWATIKDYMDTQARRHKTWISENPSE